MQTSVGVYQVADDLSHEVIITHDAILRCLAVRNVCQYAQRLTTRQTYKIFNEALTEIHR